MPLLHVENMTHYFGGLRAVHNYNLAIEAGQVRGLIGPNGAGKTTLLKAMAGLLTATEGEFLLDGNLPGEFSRRELARSGIARSFQNICLFGKISVLDNVIAGCQIRHSPSFLSRLFKTRGFQRAERKLQDRARQLLSVFGLEKQAGQRAMSLAYGDQRRLEIARALATKPRVLMIDEPAAGMNPWETQDLLDLILKLKEKFDLTIILIEHNMNLVMPLCETLQVLNYGRLVAEGTPAEIQENPEVIDAYLGNRS